MSLVNKDRVKETSTTTGTGTYTLSGAVVGFQAFTAVGNANTCDYVATDGVNWEVGLGTYTAAGTLLARTTIYASSNAGAAVNWGTGTREIAVTLPASMAGRTGFTVATLPTGVVGQRAYVTDATAPTFLGALTGGGAVITPVFKNATIWVAG
jgi:hypothetical protein